MPGCEKQVKKLLWYETGRQDMGALKGIVLIDLLLGTFIVPKFIFFIPTWVLLFGFVTYL